MSMEAPVKSTCVSCNALFGTCAAENLHGCVESGTLDLRAFNWVLTKETNR